MSLAHHSRACLEWNRLELERISLASIQVEPFLPTLFHHMKLVRSNVPKYAELTTFDVLNFPLPQWRFVLETFGFMSRIACARFQNILVFFKVYLDLSATGVATHRHSGVCSSPLSHLCLPIDVNGLHRFQHDFLDQLIVKETGDLARPHQEFELMPLSIIQSLREGTNMNVFQCYVTYKDVFTEFYFISETEAYFCRSFES